MLIKHLLQMLSENYISLEIDISPMVTDAQRINVL